MDLMYCQIFFLSWRA